MLGVRVEFHDTAFEAIISGLQSKRIDVAMGDLADTPEREKVGDLIDYQTVPQTLLVQKGNPKGINSPDHLCGTVVAGVVGSPSDEQLADDQDTACTKAGEQGVKFLKLQDATAAMLAVQTKRADVMILNFAIAKYISKTTQKTDLAGQPFGSKYHAAVVLKANQELRDAIKAAFALLMQNGTYHQILSKWELNDTAIDAPKVNGGTA